jgi:hypothetical protein
MTQPSAYREDLPESHQRLLWMGYVSDADGQGTRRYYSLRALSEAFSMFNRRLLDLCRSMELECIDLASLVPKDTTSFYDDMHFNEAGADRVAVSIFEYLNRDVAPGDDDAEDPGM